MDDGKYCTSSDGKEPGADECKYGKCTGKKIEFEKTDEEIAEVDFGKLNKFVKEFDKLLTFEEEGSRGQSKTFKAQRKRQNIKECCEESDSIKDSIATEMNASGEWKYEASSKEFGPTLIGPVPVAVQFKVSMAARFKAFESSIASSCNESEECYEKTGIQATGYGEGTVKFGIIHSSILSGEGTVRGQGSGSLAIECGVEKGDNIAID